MYTFLLFKFFKISYVLILKSLVTIRMNEILPCLTCCGQKLNCYARKSRQRQTQAVKRSGGDEIGTIILKSDIYDAF